MSDQATLDTLWGSFTEGDGSKQPQNLTDAAQQQQQQNPQQGQNPQQQQQAAPQQQTSPQQQTPPAGDDGLVDANKAAEEAKKTTEDKGETKTDGDPAGDTGEEEQYDFWEDVNKRRGRELQVDLSQFEDPTSPEAYMAVEEAVRQDEAKATWEWFKEEDQRAYAYFLHRKNGGTDEEFFSNKSDRLPEYEVFKGNVDLQKEVLTSSLKAKGVSDKVIALTLAEAEKDNSLFSEADKVYQEQKLNDERLLKAMEAENAERNQQYVQAVNNIEKSMDDVIYNNKTNRLVIPEERKPEFANFLKGRLIFDDQSNTFILGQAITPDNLVPVMEALYFQFAGGDFKKLVAKAAATQNAQGLGSKVRKAQAAAGDTAAKQDNRTPNPTMNDIWS